MMNNKLIIFFGYLMINLTSQAQTVDKIDRESLVRLVSASNDTTYVINFWATWCSPCVKEIGYFEDLQQAYISRPLKVILVSLDFPDQLEKRVIPFIEHRNISADVKLMTDLDYNSWIDLVDPSWSGAIPATLIFNKNERKFFEKEFTREELNNIVKQIFN